ncbi:hypothetical protein O181_016782 [Austropuccinia psidii MF-1]|uniref:Uncharacterized protein n=1 Tax=Austropuccinia psidii MF-1 TaxID=1389203 RepID=A0A9Q3C4Q0_9BASI|nr:hypothetical protein [Austropuccinia psidii MF-1]
MRVSFVGLLTIIRLIGKNGVEVRIPEEFSRKNPVFPVIFVKPYHQTGEEGFPSWNKSQTPKDIVRVEDYHGQVKKIRLNGKYHRQYLVTFKNQTVDKEKWSSGDAIPDCKFHLRGLEPLGGLKSIINDQPSFKGGYVSLKLKTRAQ